MTVEQPIPTASPLGPLARYEQSVIDRIADFDNPRQEWRRLVSELLGTFFLVLAAAGGGMMGQAFPGVISHTAAVTAPALTVMAVILFMGKISGAHLNPAVSIAFALRRGFPWWPGPRLHHRAAGCRQCRASLSGSADPDHRGEVVATSPGRDRIPGVRREACHHSGGSMSRDWDRCR